MLYSNPKVLSCGHSLCIKCLNDYIKTGLEDPTIYFVTCPFCRLKVIDINTNFALRDAIENMEKMLSLIPRFSDEDINELEKELLANIDKFSILATNIKHLENIKKV